ncbi:MAG: TonB family protein [Candidatus Thiodiazotropha sp. 'RUGA']|nr:TonB family protein [Candidatus Thiodiazotropha sp. 'RUGA']
MIAGRPLRYIAAIAVSLGLHMIMVTSWSEMRIEHAKIADPKSNPLLVQVSFTQPTPEAVQQNPVEKKVVKQQPPKPKAKPKAKKRPRKKIVKAEKPTPKKKPQPIIEAAPVEPSKPEAVAQPAPAKTQPKAQLLEIYLAEILSSIEQKKRYPTLARRKNIEGKVRVRFKLSCGGDITELEIQGAHGLLRKATNKAIKAAQPFPKIPQALQCPLPVTYAMAYSLKQ